MAHAVDQIEKHTIVLRLSVSIYKMADDQLRGLLNLLEQGPGNTDGSGTEPLATPDPGSNGVMQRQMIIARLFVLIQQLDRDTLLERLRFFNHPEFQWVREFPRMNCYLLVDFAAQGKVYNGAIRDISASGVFIETSDGFETDQPVDLCFSMAESTETIPFKIRGRVTRLYPNGIGVQYENISEYQRQILETLTQKSD